MGYPITVALLDKYNRPREPLSPIGWVLHATAVDGDTDEEERSYFFTAPHDASAHYFADEDSITQCIPDNEVAWHAGPTPNHTRLGVELCQIVNDGTDEARRRFVESYKRYVWLVAIKCVQYNWNPRNPNQVMSHAMASVKWKEVDHTDPCGMNGQSGYLGTWGISWVKLVDDIDDQVMSLIAIKEEAIDKLFIVTADLLNVRATPDDTSKINAQLQKDMIIHVSAKAGAWYKTTYGPLGGYVYGQYIQEYNPKPQPLPQPVPAPTGTPILGEPSATLEQAVAWAKENGASQFFLDGAYFYWTLASQYKIRPEVAYAQSAKETGFGQFKGVIDASFNNFCGLKNTQGGDNNDPNAHHRFKDIKEGVLGHIQHLALYAGVDDLQDIPVVDPRHFDSIKGKATFVEDLGGKWAPDINYGKTIVDNYLNKLLATPQPTPQPAPQPTPAPVPAPNPAPDKSIFNDIAGNWAENDIKDLFSKGIVHGDEEDNFYPMASATRAEVAVMVNNALKYLGK